MADYNLKCRVSLLRVHVRNSNKMCDGNNRCALKKFDILSEEAGWAYIGRFMMPDPGTTVGLKLLTNFTEIFRTVAVFHSRLSLSIWMETESHTRQNTLHLWLVVMRPTMENQWSRTTMQVQLSARSSSRPQLVSGNVWVVSDAVCRFPGLSLWASDGKPWGLQRRNINNHRWLESLRHQVFNVLELQGLAVCQLELHAGWKLPKNEGCWW